MARDPYNLGDELEIAVETIVCPHCGSDLAKIAQVLAPEDIEQATMDAWTRTAGGGGIGATIGALGGPVGVVIGGVLGATAGGLSSLRRRELLRTQLNCSKCGYQGNALDDSIDL